MRLQRLAGVGLIAALAIAGCGSAESPVTPGAPTASDAAATTPGTEASEPGESSESTDDATEFSCWDSAAELEALLEAMPGQSDVSVTLEHPDCGTSTSQEEIFEVKIYASSDATAANLAALFQAHSDYYMDVINPAIEIGPRPELHLPGGTMITFDHWFDEPLEVEPAAFEVFASYLDAPIEDSWLYGNSGNSVGWVKLWMTYPRDPAEILALIETPAALLMDLTAANGADHGTLDLETTDIYPISLMLRPGADVAGWAQWVADWVTFVDGIPNPTGILQNRAIVSDQDIFTIEVSAKAEDMTAEQNAELERLVQVAGELSLGEVQVRQPE